VDRTLRAALLAAFIAFAAVAGLGVFLGFGATTGSLVAGCRRSRCSPAAADLGPRRRAETFRRRPRRHPASPAPERAADDRPRRSPVRRPG
jgi:hypothetical protein